MDCFLLSLSPQQIQSTAFLMLHHPCNLFSIIPIILPQNDCSGKKVRRSVCWNSDPAFYLIFTVPQPVSSSFPTLNQLIDISLNAFSKDSLSSSWQLTCLALRNSAWKLQFYFHTFFFPPLFFFLLFPSPPFLVDSSLFQISFLR